MRAGHSRDSINCSDLASGLAFTGCRIGEAREITWRDLDFDAGEIIVRGTQPLERRTGSYGAFLSFQRLARSLNGCAESALVSHWTQSYFASVNVKNLSIEQQKRWALIASLIMICGTFFANALH